VRGGAHVALQHGCRGCLHVGDVVEAGADRVGRQVGVDVDLEPEERADRRRVLGASSFASSAVMSAMRVAASSCRALLGGIRPARSLPTIFSAISACRSAVAMSNAASVSPPRLRTSSWQLPQNLSSVASWSAVAGLEVPNFATAGGAAAGAPA
jgi:hypothetical protein